MQRQERGANLQLANGFVQSSGWYDGILCERVLLSAFKVAVFLPMRVAKCNGSLYLACAEAVIG